MCAPCAEMYAYCIAAAHNGLKHHLLDDLMVSNVAAGGEGWPLVDSLGGDVCGGEGGGGEGGGVSPLLPTVLHFCQWYRVGEYAFHKGHVPADIFSCGQPLMEVPPSNLGKDFPYWYRTQQGEVQGEVGDMRREQRENVTLSEVEMRRNAFMMCKIIESMNAAASFYKERNCDKAAEGGGEAATTTRWDKTLKLSLG